MSEKESEKSKETISTKPDTPPKKPEKLKAVILNENFSLNPDIKKDNKNK